MHRLLAMSARRITLALLCFAAAGVAVAPLVFADRDGGSSGPPSSIRETPAAEYMYEEALTARLVRRADFARRKGEPLCPPLPNPIPTAPADVPQNAPSCYRPPEEQGIVVLVLPPGDPGFGRPLDSLYELHDLSNSGRRGRASSPPSDE